MKEHAKISKEALRRGKNVLVEKPMATKMKDLIELIKRAKKNKKIDSCCHLCCFKSCLSRYASRNN